MLLCKVSWLTGVVCMFCSYSLFLPYIKYCAEIWGKSHSTSNKCLFMLQKRVIRLICGATRMDHTNMLFYGQHILKLPDVVKCKTAIIMFKAFHNLLPVNIQQLFSIYESAYTTRQNCHFKGEYRDSTQNHQLCTYSNSILHIYT